MYSFQVRQTINNKKKMEKCQHRDCNNEATQILKHREKTPSSKGRVTTASKGLEGTKICDFHAEDFREDEDYEPHKLTK